MTAAVIIVIALIGLGIWALVSTLNQQPQIPEVSQVPSTDVQSPQVTQPLTQKEVERRLTDLRQRLFEEGFTAVAKIENIYLGTGFTVMDEFGTRIFIHWTQDGGLERGKEVSVRGVAMRLTPEELSRLRSESGFTPELESFLQTQRVFIEAQQVTVAP